MVNTGSHAAKSGHRRHSDKSDQQNADKAKNVSHVPCKFFRQSVCQAGDNCPFSHEVDNTSMAVCKYFQKGNCKFGSKCALAHITPDGRHINKKPTKESRKKEKEKQKIKAKELDRGSDKNFAKTRANAGSDISQSTQSSPNSQQIVSPTAISGRGNENTLFLNRSTSDSSAHVLTKFAEISPRTMSSQVHYPPIRAFSATSLSIRPVWSTSLGFVEGSAIVDDEDESAITDDEGYREQLIPSALEDLLTPKERERRDSRNSRTESRPIISATNTDAFMNLSRRRASVGSGSGSLTSMGSLGSLGSIGSLNSASSAGSGSASTSGSFSYGEASIPLGSPGSNDIWNNKPRVVQSPFTKGSLVGQDIFTTKTRNVLDAHDMNVETVAFGSYVTSPIGSPVTNPSRFASYGGNAFSRPLPQFNRIVPAEKL
ncbi:Lee1 protein [Starmerella bacillaris]|uniref:Lee1 protein n=1 Tax=Starmerella bacillaris TaxID=1247836 RepID=A0AAV5RKQ6_STABA|nr:Lee1 protein [Starmerella bacillaris]